MSKSIFQSKTFWFQALTASATLLGVIPPTPAVIAGLALANTGLRLLSDEPVYVVNPVATKGRKPRH